MRARTAAALYGVASVLLTWPLVTSLGVAVPGWLGDQAYNIWAVDTFWTELVAGRSPLGITHRVFVPIGVNLAGLDSAPLVAFLAGPFWWWGAAGLVTFFGVLCLVAPVVGGLGMRAAVLALGAEPWAASGAGLLYAASPTLVSFIGSPWHFKVAGGALFPWTLAALLRWQAAPSMRRLLVLTAGTWALALTGYYAAAMFLVIAAAVVVVGLRRELLQPILYGLVLNGMLALLFAAFVTLPDLGDLDIGGDFFWSHAHSDLRDLFVPGTALSVAYSGGIAGTGIRWDGLLGHLARFKADTGPDPGSYYLGMGALLLMVLALWRRDGDARVLGLVLGGVLLALLAGGSQLDWGGRTFAAGMATPWWWFMQVPGIDCFDLPRCFMLGANVALLAVAGAGLARLRPSWAMGIALALVVLDYGRIGIPLATLPVPEAIRVVASLPGERTLLELPRGIVESKGGFGLGPTNSIGDYWQTVHRKPTVAAYVSRVPHRTFTQFFDTLVLGDLLVLTNAEHSFTNPADHRERRLTQLPGYQPWEVEAFVRNLDLGAVLLEAEGVPEDVLALYRREVERLLAGRIAWQRSFPDGCELYVISR